MTTINLKRYYPYMTESMTMEVSDEIGIYLDANGNPSLIACDAVNNKNLKRIAAMKSAAAKDISIRVGFIMKLMDLTRFF